MVSSPAFRAAFDLVELEALFSAQPDSHAVPAQRIFFSYEAAGRGRMVSIDEVALMSTLVEGRDCRTVFRDLVMIKVGTGKWNFETRTICRMPSLHGWWYTEDTLIVVSRCP